MTQIEKYKGVLVTGQERKLVIDAAERILFDFREAGLPPSLATTILMVAMAKMITGNTKTDDERELHVRVYADDLRSALGLPRFERTN